MPSKARSDCLHSAGLNSKIHRGFMVLTEVLTKSTKPPGRRLSAELSIFMFVHSRCSAKNIRTRHTKIDLLAAFSLKKVLSVCYGKK